LKRDPTSTEALKELDTLEQVCMCAYVCVNFTADARMYVSFLCVSVCARGYLVCVRISFCVYASVFVKPGPQMMIFQSATASLSKSSKIQVD
jgi:hypothetical protein